MNREKSDAEYCLEFEIKEQENKLRELSRFNLRFLCEKILSENTKTKCEIIPDFLPELEYLGVTDCGETTIKLSCGYNMPVSLYFDVTENLKIRCKEVLNMIEVGNER